ncbi:MAG TPA: MFS transporter [Ferrovibrio sp.]|uniref:MFS transporter n=1 Tax=Ferrovibrio sp. TaxID=1917215 RepID=UPI002ED04611
MAAAELLCTTLWFSANSASFDLTSHAGWSPSDIGWITSAVQVGFIAGTVMTALSGMADRLPASRIFFAAAILGALANAAFIVAYTSFPASMAFRFLVGLALAGIYPIGMKLVISWTKGHAGRTLSLLVGMLTLGTALPHGIRGMGVELDWKAAVMVASGLSVLGGIAILLLGDGPHLRLRRLGGRAVAAGRILHVFRISDFRAAALGYFGHMWELYAFWTLVPFLVQLAYAPYRDAAATTVSLISFSVIGMGAVGCLIGGAFGARLGGARVAAASLFASGLICLLYPLSESLPLGIRLAILLFWGVAVVADSPQFSGLSASACPPESIGGALAVQNAIGFSITIVSIGLATRLFPVLHDNVSLILLPGPVLGLVFMRGLLRGSRVV